MGQRMTAAVQELVKSTIVDANTPPGGIGGCVQLVVNEGVITLENIRDFGAELRRVCNEALAARADRDAVSLTPPLSDISHISTDPVPASSQDDRALRAAAASCSHDTHEIVHLYKRSTCDFHWASAKFSNAEFSYIFEKRLRDLEIPHNNRFVQIGWKGPSLPPGGDQTAKETVFVLVGDDEISREEMNVDILFGRHFNADVDVQLQAVRASMDLQPAPPPCDIQPDESCSGSVAAEAPVLPTQAARAESPPPQPSYIFAFTGPDQAQHAANFYKAMASSAATCAPG